MSDRSELDRFFRREDDEFMRLFARRMEPFVTGKYCEDIQCTELELKAALKQLVEANRVNRQRRNLAIGALITALIGGIGAWLFSWLPNFKE